MYTVNVDFSKSVYTLLKNKKYIIKDNDLKKIKSWVKNMNKNLNVKINSNHFDSYEFENNKFFLKFKIFYFFYIQIKAAFLKMT